jgi:glycosyltransferase involved in cell wall biosynthesis
MRLPLPASGVRTAVVLCTYNGARFVSEQLGSVLRQTRLPDELIMVDDASVDETMRLLEDFRWQAEKLGVHGVAVRNSANLGYVANFEFATSLAQAELIFLCDQDDVWHREKIARMVEVFLARPALSLLHTNARLVDANGADMHCSLFEALEVTADELVSEHAGAGFEALLRRNLVTGATTAFRSGLLRDARPFPDCWVHDEWLAIVAAATGQIDCMEEPLIDYRQHGANQIGVRRRSAAEKFSGGKSRRAHMRSVVARLEKLSNFVVDSGIATHPHLQAALTQRLLHARVRAELPDKWPARWRQVMGEACSGRYGRYSFGPRSIVADLLGLD